MQIVTVKFNSPETFEYNSNGIELKVGDSVICESENGLSFATVEKATEEKNTEGEIKKVVRLATEQDKKRLLEISEKGKSTLVRAREIVKQHGLEMKLDSAEYTFDMGKLTIVFTADGRVDFRDLLKSLANEFRTRIELKQVGVRDEAKVLGGYGPCGRPLCCGSFLKDFGKVSIKMAKDQNLSLNPNGINGVCGRLLCCLGYEQNDYQKALEKMPRLGSKVTTPDGIGVVTYNNVLKDEVSVKFIADDGTYSIKDYGLAEIKFGKDENGEK